MTCLCGKLQTIDKFSAGAPATRPLSCYTPSLGPSRKTAVVSVTHQHCYYGMEVKIQMRIYIYMCVISDAAEIFSTATLTIF